jgi:hypothetical protein
VDPPAVSTSIEQSETPIEAETVDARSPSHIDSVGHTLAASFLSSPLSTDTEFHSFRLTESIEPIAVIGGKVSKRKSWSLWVGIGIGLAVLVAIALLILFLLLKEKKGSESENVPDETECTETMISIESEDDVGYVGWSNPNASSDPETVFDFSEDETMQINL